MGVLQKIIGLFTYHEPENKERGFELLEGQGERGTDPNKKHIENQNNQNQGKDNNQNNQADKPISITEAIHQGIEESNNNSVQSVPRISGNLNDNLNFIEDQFNIPVNQDVIIRQLKIGRSINAFLVYMEGMVDKKIINQSLLKRSYGTKCGKR